jgi:hypothetical protein
MLYAWSDGVVLGGFGPSLGARVQQAHAKATVEDINFMVSEYSEILTDLGFKHEIEVAPLPGEVRRARAQTRRQKSRSADANERAGGVGEKSGRAR